MDSDLTLDFYNYRRINHCQWFVLHDGVSHRQC